MSKTTTTASNLQDWAIAARVPVANFVYLVYLVYRVYLVYLGPLLSLVHDPFLVHDGVDDGSAGLLTAGPLTAGPLTKKSAMCTDPSTDREMAYETAGPSFLEIHG
jgi:hypothetical protein